MTNNQEQLNASHLFRTFNIEQCSSLNNHIHLHDISNSLTFQYEGITPQSSLQSVKTFEELRLNPLLLKGIFNMGFRHPSRFEERTLPQLFVDPPRNMIVQSPNGTGKTVAFLISILNRIDPSLNYVQALILSPTSELALKIGSIIEKMAKFLPYIQVAYAIRDPVISRRRAHIKRKELNIPIVIGTPGTVEDWAIKMQIIDLKKLHMFVIDEADYMIKLADFSQICIHLIQKRIRKNCQTMLFSSKDSDEVMNFAKQIIENPVISRSKSEELNIHQFYIECENDEKKYDAVKRIYQSTIIRKSIIFCSTQYLADELQSRMRKDKQTVESFSSKSTIDQRIDIINRFRDGKFRFLIVTNICPCQIDIDDLSLAINFQLPLIYDENKCCFIDKPDYDIYLHRIKLVRPPDRIGYTFNLINPLEKHLLVQVENHFKESIKDFLKSDIVVKQPYLPIITTLNPRLIYPSSGERNTPFYSSVKFQDLHLKFNLLKGISHMNFLYPSKIQVTALSHLLWNPPKNMIAQSQSGTGKTVAFALAIISRINSSIRSPQALICVPTFELAIQIGSVIKKLAQFLPYIKIAYAIRNSSMSNRDNLVRGQLLSEPIVIGTPGTIKYWCRELRVINLNKLKICCVDEADLMISTEDFQRTYLYIFRCLNRLNCQMMLFSATYSDEMMRFARQIIPNPVVLRLRHEDQKLVNITQFFIRCYDENQKYYTIEQMYSSLTIRKTMVFCQTRDTAHGLTTRMERQGQSVREIMSILEIEQREAIIRKFREGVFRILIATNIAARGLNFEDVTLVINYDLPINRNNEPDYETYLHRIGRCGRFGKSGYALNLITTENDYFVMKSIQKYFNFTIDEITIEGISQLEPDQE